VSYDDQETFHLQPALSVLETGCRIVEAVSKARQPLFFCTLSDQKRVKKLAKIFGCSQDFSYICN
jgi:hypothetical protein